jgi:hypothetical protein
MQPTLATVVDEPIFPISPSRFVYAPPHQTSQPPNADLAQSVTAIAKMGRDVS